MPQPRRVQASMMPRKAVVPPALPPVAGPGALPTTAPKLAAGDWVRVRPYLEIQSTLDARGSLKGCRFALGMRDYCGQRLKVAKVVERFFDEAHGCMLRGRHLVLLEGAYCDGSISPGTHGCDRMCFYFWRAEWAGAGVITPAPDARGEPWARRSRPRRRSRSRGRVGSR